MTIDEHRQILQLVEDGKIDDALARLDALPADSRSESDALITRATILNQLGDHHAALDLLNGVVSNDPDHPVALLMMAATLLQCDRKDESRQIYEAVKALKQEPWRSEAESGLQRIEASSGGGRPKVAIVCGGGMDTFIRPVQAGLAEKYDFKLFTVASLRDVRRAMEWADVCWFEWCDEILARASTQIPKCCAVVCRMHSYEVFEATPAKVDWTFVDKLIIVAEHVGQIFKATVEVDVDTVLVHNGVNVESFSFSSHSKSTELAYLGYLNHKKNPSLLLQIIAKLAAIDPAYRLHVGGVFQELRYKIYFDYMIRTLGLQENVVEHGWIEDVDEWLDDKDYILSTSVFESFGFSIAEGMAKGLKPIVHKWPGASALYPEEILFSTVDEAVAMIRSPEMRSDAYRDFIQDHYGLNGQLAKIDGLLSELVGREVAAQAA